MTKFLVTGEADWWHVFWMLATWSAAYLIAAVVLREVFANPKTWMEKYGLWFGRIVGPVGASIIFAYGYRTTGELERVEHECQLYKALAEKRASGVNDPTYVALRSMDLKNGLCVEWEHCNDGRNRPVSITNRRTDTSGNRIQSGAATDDRACGSIDCMPRRTSGVTTSTNGDAATF